MQISLEHSLEISKIGRSIHSTHIEQQTRGLDWGITVDTAYEQGCLQKKKEVNGPAGGGG